MEFVKLSLDYLPEIYLWHREQFDKIGFDKPPSLKETEELVEGWISDESKIVFIVKHNNEPIGYVALNNINKHHNYADLTIVIGDKKYIGQKVCVDVSSAILNYAFINLGLYRVTIYISENNTKLLKGVIKYGFTQEGIMRETLKRDSERINCYIFGILKREFLKEGV